MSDEDKLIQNSLLFLAIRTKKLISTQLDSIIEQGGDINAKDANDGNNTPLHVAAKKGDPEIVRLLLDKGANVAEKNSSGQTPLEVAEGSEVVSLLQEHLQEHVPETKLSPDSMQSTSQCETTIKIPIFYTRRSGSSGGALGHFNETKLLTLILFRALNTKDIVEFYLGSNVDGLEALDDVVFWFRDIEGRTRILFFQAKHRENHGKFPLEEIFKISGDYSMPKYYESYLSIRRKFGSKNEKDLFKIDFKAVECQFVVYTTAEADFSNEKGEKLGVDILNFQDESITPGLKLPKINHQVKNLITTAKDGIALHFHTKLHSLKDMLTEKATRSTIRKIGKSLADLILNKRTLHIMKEPLIKEFHVILAQKVFIHSYSDNSTVTTKFRTEFFKNNDEWVKTLRDALYDAVIEKRKQDRKPIIDDETIEKFMHKQSAENISELLGNVLIYNNTTGFLNVNDNRYNENKKFMERLTTITVAPEIIRKATEIIARKELELSFQFPMSFGNFKHIQNLLHDLKTKSEECLTNRNTLKCTDITRGIDLPCMVGTYLTLDTETKLFKLNFEEISQLTKFKEFNEIEIEALKNYRFEITNKYFPKLLWTNKEDEEMSMNFLDNFVLYTNQAKESKIDQMLKDEIKARYNMSDPILCDAVFSMVHDKVLKLWKQQENVPYLTKNCDYFDKVVALVRDNLPLTNLSAICTLQINRFQIKFNTASVDALASQIKGGVTNIISSHVEQCCIKLLQHFSANSRLFITEQYLQVALPYLRQMLQLKPNLWKIVIVVGDQKSIDSIKEIITGFKKSQKHLIIVTDGTFFTKETLFSCGNTINYGGDVFKNLCTESQETLLKEREVFFQRTEIKLNQLANDKLKGTIDAEMLSLLISKQELCIAKETKSAKYKNIENFLIQRELKRPVIKIKQGVKDTKSDVWVYSSEDFNSKCNENEKINVHWIDSQGIWRKSRGSLEKVRQLADFSQFTVETLDSLDEHVVIVAAEPGMGKSTLMTELVERIKHKNPHSWVVRIDLLLFSDQFEKWNANVIDLPLVLNFLLNVQNMVPSEKCNLLTVSPDKKVMVEEALRNEISGKLLFEIELFVHNFNQGKIVFIFDGFDEISPNYEVKVINLLKVLQNLNTNKLWVTTRNDNNHLELENGLSTFSYALKPFSPDDELNYLRKRWGSKLEKNYVDSTKVDGICKKFIQLLSNSINDNRTSSFMEIPLQLEMIARIYQDKFLECYGGKPIEKLKIDFVMLYDRFFEIKFDEILYGEKAPNINKSDPKMNEMFEKERQSIMERHEKLALCALLDDQELKLFLSPDETAALLVDVESGREKVGLICQIVNSKPLFVHQTYAEFFAARFLWSKFKSKEATEEFIQDVFVPILRKHKQYQVCCFLKQIALKDFDSNTTFSGMECKISSLLVKLLAILDKETLYEKHRCARILLKIAVKFMENDEKYAEEKINSLNQEHRLFLFTFCSEEGYYNLLSCFKGLIDSSTLRENVRECGWSDDPLAVASANGHLEVVNILTKEFYHNANVNKWKDKKGGILFGYLLKLPEINFSIIQILLENDLLDGRPVYDLGSIDILLYREAPSHLIKLVANKIDFNLFNKQKDCEVMNIHRMTQYLLPYDVQLIEDIHSKGADLSQSINSLMLEYCYETMTGETRFIISDWKLGNKETLFDKIQQFLKCGIGYNRKHALCDASTMQYIKLAYNIHLFISVTKDRASSVSNFNTTVRKYAKTLELKIFSIQLKLTIPMILFFKFSYMLVSSKFIILMRELSEANAGKIFDVDQNNRILDLLLQVQSTEELERFMDEIRKCNGKFLLALLLLINKFYEGQDFFETIQEIVTFTNQSAPQIYNLWMKLDEQYRNLLEAIQTSNETVRNVLDQIDSDYRRAVINGQDPEYGSPLHYAAAKGDLELVQTLLEFGADPNSRLDETGPVERLRIDDDKMDNFRHFTPLHFAAMRGFGKVVEVLLANGAKRDVLASAVDNRRAVINGQDSEYGSPLLYAAAKGDLELTRTLLDANADPNSSLDENSPIERLRIDDDKVDTYEHFTPLHFAAMRGFGEVVEVLLKKGAKRGAVTISGWLPVDLAKENGHKDIVKLLSAENTGT